MSPENEKKFKSAQWRFIICSMIAYAFFYVTRKNIAIAQPIMLEQGVISTYAIGTILTVNGVLYGTSRFVNGFWADRLNGRIFMTIGLALSALMNVIFGCSSLTLAFAVFWVLNGWTQGMGFPPCAKMLTHWIHPKELATKMSIWNTSHSFGAFGALGICTFLLWLGLGWRWCFWVPAALAGLAAVFCFFCVKDSPTEAGVPELEIEGAKDASESSVEKGGMMTIAFELAAVVGTIFAGWFTDKVFKGRGVRTCVFCMLFAALFAFGFWYLPKGASSVWATLLIMGVGFCIYGPQALVGIMAANQATKEAAAMANGFTGIMGYLSYFVSGIGIAFIKEHYGWGVTLGSVAGFAIVGMVLFLFAWGANADGYKRNA